ncbi:MAG: threonylcarbamoyl-AMP synthase [Polyangiaceae bacterium]|nr:threonylcarbamoyl-AMP synthase [Polyangiaceae bacterium]
MRTRVIPFSEAAVREAAAVLRSGGLVAFPTETVYGLGARADRSDAVQKIFAAKGRPPTNPLIVHVSDRSAAADLSADWSASADALAKAFWPGPLTIVTERKAGSLAPEVTAGKITVGLRVPNHPAALALLREANLPVAAPSANRSMSISPTTAEHVLKTLSGVVDVVLDAGKTGFGIESTIVDTSQTPMRLLRHGALPLSEIARFGDVVDAAKVICVHTAADAPGMFAKHYAPRAKALLVAGEALTETVNALRSKGKRVGVMELGPTRCGTPHVELGAEADVYASRLYAALHQLDDEGCDVIVIENVPNGPEWAAVRDRLMRATAE